MASPLSAWFIKTFPSEPELIIAFPVWFQITQLIGPLWLEKHKLGSDWSIL